MPSTTRVAGSTGRLNTRSCFVAALAVFGLCYSLGAPGATPAACPAAPSGCPNITNSPALVAANTTVSIQILGTPPSGVSTLLSNAIAAVNANSTVTAQGNTFGLTTSSSSFTVQFDTTTTTPGCGCVADSGVPQLGANSTLTGVTLVVYLAATGCPGACFSSPGSAAWNNAVQGTLTHELLHMVGEPDLAPSTVSQTLNDIMEQFSGTNNANNPTLVISNCDNSILTIMRNFFKAGNYCTTSK
jgi:hypothetical protein